jgi:hypothetical protein
MAETVKETEEVGSDLASAREALAQIFKHGETIWLVEQSFDEARSSWFFVVVRRGPQARWVRQRYRYDSADRVLFFLGERPVSDQELSEARRSAEVIYA